MFICSIGTDFKPPPKSAVTSFIIPGILYVLSSPPVPLYMTLNIGIATAIDSPNAPIFLLKSPISTFDISVKPNPRSRTAADNGVRFLITSGDIDPIISN